MTQIIVPDWFLVLMSVSMIFIVIMNLGQILLNHYQKYLTNKLIEQTKKLKLLITERDRKESK
jgi:hypothetical protein